MRFSPLHRVGFFSDDAEDVTLATSHEFWRMIRQRRAGGKSVPIAEVEATLETTSGKASKKRTATRKAPQHP
ncbi:MAG: hypothetical protein ACLQIB_18880 [Isosphaeraceae bacterium]